MIEILENKDEDLDKIKNVLKYMYSEDFEHGFKYSLSELSGIIYSYHSLLKEVDELKCEVSALKNELSLLNSRN